jgi:hypothetical protein
MRKTLDAVSRACEVGKHDRCTGGTHAMRFDGSRTPATRSVCACACHVVQLEIGEIQEKR